MNNVVEKICKLCKGEKLASILLFIAVLVIGFFLCVYLRLASAIYILMADNVNYFASTMNDVISSLLFVALIIICTFVINSLNKKYLLKPLYLAGIASSALSIVGMFISDLFWMYGSFNVNTDVEFGDLLSNYFAHEWWLYLAYFIFIGALAYILRFFKRAKELSRTAQRVIFIFPVILVLILFPYALNAKLFILSEKTIFVPLSNGIVFSIGYLLLSGLFWMYVFSLKDKYELRTSLFIKLATISSVSAVVAILIPLLSLVSASRFEILRNGLTGLQAIKLFNHDMLEGGGSFIPLVLALISNAALRIYFKKEQFNEENKNTSGKFGSAKWATKNDLKSIHVYDEKNGAIIGSDDDGKLLYLPFTNKLTLAPPGSGKTVSSSIPILLTYNGPAFVFDIKGELWATTARYRSEVMGRRVIVIDPYRVTKEEDFITGKSNSLIVEHSINPFDFIPENEAIRDRMINAFASSFIISDDVKNSGGARHFDENAKILIRGYIDHMMKVFPKEKRNLATLYNLLSEDSESAKKTFQEMSELSGRAGAAANQVNRVGGNERGSILSTSYRQIDWMSDSNMQAALETSDFNLRDFLGGEMDIYVVIPEDQVKEHGRLIRMLMSLLMGIIVQANPSQLPKNKILFLLDEVAQLGYCPDVEQCIEVLRARGVVVWTVFQSLSQIEMFQKPDLFKGVSLKQIFTLDDVKTMEWIKALGGKTTVLNKTISSNKGDSRQKMQVFGGKVSQGVSESVQETAADLIQVNEIRELPADDQFIFIHGQKPIRCKKIRYFEHPFFVGKFDPNPVEARKWKV